MAYTQSKPSTVYIRKYLVVEQYMTLDRVLLQWRDPKLVELHFERRNPLSQ